LPQRDCYVNVLRDATSVDSLDPCGVYFGTTGGQVYVSPALMENYSSWAAEPSSLLSEQTREFLTRLGSIAEPITYSLSNEGMGPLHEVHIPKNLALMAIAGLSGETNQPPTVGIVRTTI
jgi:hypothetical protein